MIVVCLFVAGALAFVGLRHRSERGRAQAMERGLPGLAAQLAREVEAGAPLVLALRTVASGRGPLAVEVQHVVGHVDRGTALADALDAWRRRSGSDGVALLVAACRLGHAEGGATATALDGVALTLLDRLEVADEARALASQARASTYALVALPPLGASAFAVIDPGVGRSLVATAAGRICLVVGLALDAAGAGVSWWLVGRATR